MEIFAEIKGIKYTPLLCRELETYSITSLGKAIEEKSSFIIEINEKDRVAVSWWVSPKRTRSYPYARVYDTLGFSGKKITIIPIIKDEGKDGDRDFLQWDTISLMSLLGIYVIVSYYVEAEKSGKYDNKITKQRFDIEQLKKEIIRILSYQSDALHWNLEQIERIPKIAELAFMHYENISKKLGVEMHSPESARQRIKEIKRGKEVFMNLSRKLAHESQRRESITSQPKEYLSGEKANITIKNYLGGYYYFTCDEVEIHANKLYLIEGKHTKTGILPSTGDIKDGLIKMILFTNLVNVFLNEKEFVPIPVLKLTSTQKLDFSLLKGRKRNFMEELKKEAKINGFKLKVNDLILI